MRFARFAAFGAAHIGMVEGNQVYDLTMIAQERGQSNLVTIESLIAANMPESYWKSEAHRSAGCVHDLADIRLLSPIARPNKILCLALNYGAHVAETGHKRPTKPYTFLKPSTAIIGPEDAVRYPDGCEHLSFEAELAVVIGKAGRGIRADQAYDHVFGYTILNDMSARDLGKTDIPTLAVDWYLSKGFDTSAPTGPWIVTRSELTDPHNLDLCLTVNGEVRQHGNTEQMFYQVPEVIEVLSRNVMLEPGDIIATGTPAGATGKVQAGDIIEITIESIGMLRNSIVKA